MKSLHEICPTFETGSFVVRLISEEDSEDLLKCYSDSKAQQFFNSDKCTGDFCIDNIEDMLLCTQAIGTIEMFGNVGKYKNKTGILRVDVSSDYENSHSLDQIYRICAEQLSSESG